MLDLYGLDSQLSVLFNDYYNTWRYLVQFYKNLLPDSAILDT
jgi:hypothetical protein